MSYWKKSCKCISKYKSKLKIKFLWSLKYNNHVNISFKFNLFWYFRHNFSRCEFNSIFNAFSIFLSVLSFLSLFQLFSSLIWHCLCSTVSVELLRLWKLFQPLLFKLNKFQLLKKFSLAPSIVMCSVSSSSRSKAKLLNSLILPLATFVVRSNVCTKFQL